MSMRRSDFRAVSDFICTALDCIEANKPKDAKAALEDAISWLDKQQFQKPRGIPFSIGEDMRRKDRLVRP